MLIKNAAQCFDEIDLPHSYKNSLIDIEKCMGPSGEKFITVTS